MSDGARRALLIGLCWIATACATTSARYFARMDAKGRGLVKRQRWDDALRVSQTALAKCDQTDWCSKDPRYQGLFHNTIGEAQEHLNRRDLALEHYQKAFYSYPLFFKENYFRMLKELGMYRQLRHEIDVKLASTEADYRGTTAVWAPAEPSACSGRSVAGTYSWRLRAAGGSGKVSGKAVVSQSGCVASADFALPDERVAGGHLHFRGDVGTGIATLLFGSPCPSTDRGQLSLAKNGFTVNADRPTALQGCLHGPYVMEFVKD